MGHPGYLHGFGNLLILKRKQGLRFIGKVKVSIIAHSWFNEFLGLQSYILYIYIYENTLGRSPTKLSVAYF